MNRKIHSPQRLICTLIQRMRRIWLVFALAALFLLNGFVLVAWMDRPPLPPAARFALFTKGASRAAAADTDPLGVTVIIRDFEPWSHNLADTVAFLPQDLGPRLRQILVVHPPHMCFFWLACVPPGSTVCVCVCVFLFFFLFLFFFVFFLSVPVDCERNAIVSRRMAAITNGGVSDSDQRGL
jgi:hypothetical protein